MRDIVCAGLLTTGLLIGGAGIAVADTGDTVSEGTEGTDVASVTINVDSRSDRKSDAKKPDPPTGTFGSGRDDVDVKSTEKENKKKNNSPVGTRKFTGSLISP